MHKYATLPEREAFTLRPAKRRVTEMFVSNHPNTSVYCGKQKQETVLGSAISGAHSEREIKTLVYDTSELTWVSRSLLSCL